MIDLPEQHPPFLMHRLLRPVASRCGKKFLGMLWVLTLMAPIIVLVAGFVIENSLAEWYTTDQIIDIMHALSFYGAWGGGIFFVSNVLLFKWLLEAKLGCHLTRAGDIPFAKDVTPDQVPELV